ncbi:MAG: MarR family transcriptional regulator [Chromatiales bacterium]|jgi:DNA-binding MarR family transcriptional regulator
MTAKPDRCEEVLVALRRLIRAVDLHSRHLAQTHGLTSPQALILKEALAGAPLSAGEIARRVSLSQATVTDILNRLERRGLLTRVRSNEDRRRVLVQATRAGRDLMRRSPPLLQERFAERFMRLADWEQTMLLASLQRIAGMMDAGDIDAAPVLSSGAMTAPIGEVEG